VHLTSHLPIFEMLHKLGWLVNNTNENNCFKHESIAEGDGHSEKWEYKQRALSWATGR
jgi:hypothetical protein